MVLLVSVSEVGGGVVVVFLNRFGCLGSDVTCWMVVGAVEWDLLDSLAVDVVTLRSSDFALLLLAFCHPSSVSRSLVSTC